MIHLIKNKRGKSTAGSEITETLMDITVDEEPLKELAEVSEEAHFELKNRYRHDKKTMQYADKKRMPVDE